MLAAAVLAHYESKEPEVHAEGKLTVTGISPCPNETYIHFHHLDDEKPGGIERLRMKNGHWQEMEVLEDLRSAGFKIRYTGTNQMVVHVGKVPITGRPDGLITVDGREDVLSIKAMSIDRYTNFKQKGLEEKIKCQEQLYLASEELKDKAGTWIYVKHKDSCRPYDIFMEKDLNYSKPIIEAAEEIILGNVAVSRPEICPMPGCHHRLFCFKEELLDTSGIKVVSLPEVVEMWLEGQFYLDTGKELNEQARTIFRTYLGDNDVLFAEFKDTILQIKKIIQRRYEIDKGKFIEKFGASALPEVLVEKVFEQMRVIRRDYPE